MTTTMYPTTDQVHAGWLYTPRPGEEPEADYRRQDWEESHPFVVEVTEADGPTGWEVLTDRVDEGDVPARFSTAAEAIDRLSVEVASPGADWTFLRVTKHSTVLGSVSTSAVSYIQHAIAEATS